MPVTPELLNKIADYEKQGYTSDEIVAGLQQSKNFPDVAQKINAYQGQQYGSDEILQGIKASPVSAASGFNKSKGQYGYTPAEMDALRKQFASRQGDSATVRAEAAPMMASHGGTLPTDVMPSPPKTTAQRFQEAGRAMIAPTAPATGLADWAGRVVPESAAKLIPRVAAGTYEAVKGQTDPIVKAFTTEWDNPNYRPGSEMMKNAANTVKGVGAAMTQGLGFGQNQQGDVTWSPEQAKQAWLTDPVGAAAGLAPMVKGAKGAAASLGEAVSSRVGPEALYSSSLKMSTGKKLSIPERSARAQTGLEGGYVPSEKGYGKLLDDIDTVNQEIGQKIAEGKNAGKMVSVDDVVKTLDPIRERAQYDINPQPLLDSINELENSLYNHPKAVNGEIPIDVAQKMKIETYRSLKNAYGEMKSTEVEARKAVARGLKDQIATLVPEISDLNAKDSALINLEKSLGQATKRIANRDVTGLSGPLKLAGGAVADLAGGHGIGVATGALLWMLDDPKVKANLAIALHKARIRKGIRSTVAQAKSDIPKLIASAAAGVAGTANQNQQENINAR